MLATLGRVLQGPPLLIIGGLILLQLLALHVPMLFFGILVAGIIAAFLMLMRPPWEAAAILALSGIAYTLLGYLLVDESIVFLAPLIFLGVPALLAAILRMSGSLSLAILGGFLAAWLGGQMLGWLPLDFDASWAATLENVREAAQQAGNPEPFGGLPLERLSLIGAEVVMASLALLATLLLLLARAWQSSLADAPFFSAEFRAVHYGHIAGMAFLLVIVAAWWHPSPFILGLALTLIAAFLFPGIATVHRVVGRMRYALAVLIPFYVLLLTLQEAALVVAVVGATGDLLRRNRQTIEHGNTF